MNELTFFQCLILAWFAVAGAIFIALFFIVAPYGRHTKRNWGLTIKSKTGWIIMESTAPLIFAVWTAANLVPRARAHHQWYRKYFPDYPSHRKTLVPGIW